VGYNLGVDNRGEEYSFISRLIEVLDTGLCACIYMLVWGHGFQKTPPLLLVTDR